MTIAIEAFSAADVADNLGALARLLHACVHSGASVGFILPHPLEESETFWRTKVEPAVAAGSRLMLVARFEHEIAGTVQLDYDTPGNQPHRAEVRKLLVDPRFRRRGIARRLMVELESRARRLNRSLLTLDTRPGDGADQLYRDMGYQTTGLIPGFCRDNFVDRYDPTAIMYKRLVP